MTARHVWRTYWPDLILFAWRMIWCVGTFIEFSTRSEHPAPFLSGMFLLGLLFSFALPLCLLRFGTLPYLMAEAAVSGSFLLFALAQGDLLVGSGLIIMTAGYYSRKGGHVWWSAPVFAVCLPLLLSFLGAWPVVQVVGEVVDSAFAFCVGLIFQLLLQSQKQVKAYARQVEELTILAERNRMAGELHDSVGFTFTSLLMGLQLLKPRLEEQDAPAKLQELIDLTRKGHEDARRIIHQMEPAGVDLSLSSQCRSIAEEFSRSSGAALTFQQQGKEPSSLPKTLKLALCRCLQEALANAVRHGKATSIEVQLQYDSGTAELTVHDNGIGSGEMRYGFGLRSMKERIESLGGQLTVSRFLDRGMRLRCSLPVPASAQEDKITVVIADDEQLLRESISQFLATEGSFVIAGVAENGKEALDICDAARPQIVLLDVHMPEMDGVEAARLIKERLPDTRIILLTHFDDRMRAMQALHYGADGYLLKSLAPEALIEKIKLVSRGETLIAPEVTRSLIRKWAEGLAGEGEAYAASSPGDCASGMEAANEWGLSERDLHLLILLARGLTYRDIAKEMHLAEGTIRNYISTVYAKLDVKNKQQAIMKAKEAGVI